MKKSIILGVCLGTLLTPGYLGAQNITQQQETFKGIIGEQYKDSKESWTDPVKAPEGAPNVVWILLDDVGFGAASAFGGLIPTPTFDSLANNGLRYTNFHTAAICAPTRAALLTGRNHHRVHEGGFSHKWASFGFPGWDGRIPSDKGTIAEILRENGYNTFAVGKYGLTPDQDATDAGPFDRWPSGKGFDHFFGFLGSATDQYKPDLVEDNAHVDPDGRHLSEQITDKAISFIDRQKKADPAKPFFLYYSPAAVHSPHQVEKKWRDLYKGKFDDGWDVYREEVFERQKKLGLIPANATLPARNPYIKAWNDLSDDAKKVYTRFFEVYAGYLTYTDYEVGRLIDHLQSINQLDNTLILLVIGDNGGSKEGTQYGTIKRAPATALLQEQSEEEAIKAHLENFDLIGTPEATNGNYPLGWAQATNTPFKYWKQDAHAEGGTRNPLIVFYPKTIKEKGGLRHQYGYVNDLLPTTLEFLNIEAPTYIRGIKQDSIQTSLFYSFNDKEAPSQHLVQYYYIFGSRAIYKDGWKASLAFKIDENKGGRIRNVSFDDPANIDWQLYHLDEDFNEQNDLSKQHPEKLEELKALFDEEAKVNNVYPLINWDDVVDRRSTETK
ncbi:arylsulfatase [Olivibacter sp. SDN3]|uniref:arylsulfatase n=1 Tax=Olivibacter sp. SDN3 TaxID=2764720 RepID=UPI0016518F31|nr:arylsulfatase [Olivibacter sp. SDN3]QNL50408.1 arylsulfatase [Olivibacter sp. SDN3]